jgi:hypothetical protein
MTTRQIVSLFKARRAGRGKFIARCPVHGRDRSPSLYITERPNGSTGVHCFAGCPVQAVLGAVGLTLRDLFVDTKPDREAMALAEKLRAEAGRERMKLRQELRKVTVWRKHWEGKVRELGKLLAERPESDRLNELFRGALQKWRRFGRQEVELMCQIHKFKRGDLPWG